MNKPFWYSAMLESIDLLPIGMNVLSLPYVETLCMDDSHILAQWVWRVSKCWCISLCNMKTLLSFISLPLYPEQSLIIGKLSSFSWQNQIFPKFSFLLESSDFIIGNKYWQLFSFEVDGLTSFILEKILPGIQILLTIVWHCRKDNASAFLCNMGHTSLSAEMLYAYLHLKSTSWLKRSYTCFGSIQGTIHSPLSTLQMLCLKINTPYKLPQINKKCIVKGRTLIS